jgi:hypothetical protein
MAKLLRPKRRKRALGCLLAAGVVVACFLGVGQAVRWWTGVVFPGTQFFYSSDSIKPQVFRLTVQNSWEVVRLRIPPVYIDALIPGGHFGYAFIDLSVYLPDMVPEPVYDARYSLAGKSYPPNPNEHQQQKLNITLSQSDSGPSDPSGEVSYVKHPVDAIKKLDRPLRNNPYPEYDAYIWSVDGGDTIDGNESTQTDYIPRDTDQFYVDCTGEGGPNASCSVLFVLNSLLNVDVDIAPDNISQAENIMQKVSTFVEPMLVYPHG